MRANIGFYRGRSAVLPVLSPTRSFFDAPRPPGVESESTSFMESVASASRCRLAQSVRQVLGTKKEAVRISA